MGSRTGGGIIGSTTAYYLTRHPSYNPALHTIHLIEATGIASGASGKAGGLLALWAYPSSIVPLSFRLHKELAKEHDGEKRWGYRALNCGQLNIKGRRIGEAAAEGTGKPAELNGPHDVEREQVSLQKRSQDSYKAVQAAGVPDDLDWLVDSKIQSYHSMGTPENTAQVHPYQFTTSMAELAEEKGAKIVIGSVTSINYKDQDPDKGVESVTYTPKASPSSSNSSSSSNINQQILPATDILLTAGPWTSSLLPGAPISALRAHSITIRPSRPNISPYAIFPSITLPANFRPSDRNKKSIHVTPEIYARPDNTLYACGEGDTLVPLPPTSADVAVDQRRCADIADYCAAISDELRDGEVVTRQACYLPQVEGAVAGPLIGHTGTKGLYLAAGHTCWGIQNGPATGRLLSEFVFEGKAKSARGVGGLDPRMVL